jgi:hypothetical protein
MAAGSMLPEGDAEAPSEEVMLAHARRDGNAAEDWTLRQQVFGHTAILEWGRAEGCRQIGRPGEYIWTPPL